VPAYRRLSASPLWAAQRRFYERAGIDAWRTGTVPHHVTSNVALAHAYARIVHGFLRDTARPGPLDVIELGAGPGRFAFLFLRALDALGSAPVRYVMTDVARSTIQFWRHHEALAPFVRAGRLHFARLGVGSPGPPWEGEHRPSRLAGARGRGREDVGGAPLVVIANYVFGGLPHDAFVSRAGRLHDYLVWARLRVGEDAATASLAWRRGAPVTAPYRDDDLDAVLHARARRRAGPMLFPVGALRVLQHLGSLAEDVLVLVADRGTEEEADAITPARDLGAARHGAISFPVDFAALRAWVARRGGRALRPPRLRLPLHVAGLLLGGRGDWPATGRAYAAAMEDGGPATAYRLRRALAAGGGRATPAALLGLIGRCGPDPRVVAECVRPLWPHLAEAGPRLRRDVARAVLDAWPNDYHLPEPHDVPFALGLLLYAARAYADARRLFEASRRLHGDDAATWWNLGLCHVALGRPDAARAAFRRARRLAPGLPAAGPATVKVGHAPRRARRAPPLAGRLSSAGTGPAARRPP
jgi:hypothetical protein